MFGVPPYTAYFRASYFVPGPGDWLRPPVAYSPVKRRPPKPLSVRITPAPSIYSPPLKENENSRLQAPPPFHTGGGYFIREGVISTWADMLRLAWQGGGGLCAGPILFL